MAEGTDQTLKEILTNAKQAEAQQNIEDATRLYQQAINKDSLNEQAFTRLMTIFRKQKEYKKELRIINNGIKVFEKFYRSQARHKSKSITEISNKLNRSVGLIDRKGNSLYDPEPIAKWKKRKVVVEKKIKS